MSLLARGPSWRRTRFRRLCKVHRALKARGAVKACEAADEDQKEARSPRQRWTESLDLVGDMAPREAWTYPLFQEEWRCFAGYLPQALPPKTRARFFRLVHEGTVWLQPSGRWGPLPLQTAWMCQSPCSCRYRYGGAEVLPAPFPEWMAEVMSVCMPLCGLSGGQWPNSCNLNLYQDGQHSVGWHADNEALFQGKVKDCRIISLSLGQSRRFELLCGQDFHRLELGDGDLCTMEGMTQKYYKHRVPKVAGKNVGARINLTWRWIVQHHDCPCAPCAPCAPAPQPSVLAPATNVTKKRALRETDEDEEAGEQSKRTRRLTRPTPSPSEAADQSQSKAPEKKAWIKGCGGLAKPGPFCAHTVCRLRGINQGLRSRAGSWGRKGRQQSKAKESVFSCSRGPRRRSRSSTTSTSTSTTTSCMAKG